MENKYLEELKKTFNNCADVKFRQLNREEGSIYIIFIDNMCDSRFINEFIIAPLLDRNVRCNDINTIKNEILITNLLGSINNLQEATKNILEGNVVLIFTFINEAVYCESKRSVRRQISYPDSETTTKGPKDSFNENIADNISLIRQRVQNVNLKIESFEIGKKSNTKVYLLYIEDTCPKELVDYIKKKLININIDFILDSNYIEEEFKCKRTFFDTVAYNEKPDSVSSRLFEGRGAIIVNGTPFVITLPSFFSENFVSSDFYYLNKYVASYSKILLVIIFMISITLPGLYVALSTNHLNLIPLVFIFKLGRSRAQVPFPTIVEMILMLFFFDIARLAGKLIPQRIGQSVSVVAALILGNAAIDAGIASEITVVVMGIVTISTVANTKLFGASRFWTIVITLFSATLGLPGFYAALIILLAHIAGLNSCGYPYLFPIGTSRAYKFKENFFSIGNLSEISKNILKREKND